MVMLQSNIKSTNSLLINDNGTLVEIKQPSIIELNIIYQAIIANKQVINTVFSNSFEMSKANGSFLENLERPEMYD